MGCFGKKETSEEEAEAALPATKKISLNFRGLSSAAVRDMGRSTIGEVAVMPDLKGLAANDNISSIFNAAAAFTSLRRPPAPKGPAP